LQPLILLLWSIYGGAVPQLDIQIAFGAATTDRYFHQLKAKSSKINICDG